MVHRILFFLGLLTMSLSGMVLAMMIGNIVSNDGHLSDPNLAWLTVAMAAIGAAMVTLSRRSRRKVHTRTTEAVERQLRNAGHVDASVVAMYLRCSLDDAVATLDDLSGRLGLEREQLRSGFDVRYRRRTGAAA